MTKWRFSIEQLREAVTYNPETGRLTWLVRPLSHFPNQRICNSVNAQFAARAAAEREHGFHPNHGRERRAY